MTDAALTDRLNREVLHGATETAVRQAEFGWLSAAGKLRRQRRIDFLCQTLPKTAKVLEIGAGTGIQTLGLLQYFSDVTGIDISPDLLRVAEKRAPGAKYEVMDAHNPNYADESFDAVVGISILHHLNWELALKSAHRLLKHGGVVRFSEPNMLNPQIFLQKNIPWLKRLAGDSPDETAFTRWQIASALRKAGFERINVRPFEFLHPGTPEKYIPLLSKLEKLVSATPINEIAGSLLIEAWKA